MSPDKVNYGSNVYEKVYDHDGGGTYYSCPNSHYDWLDIYPDGEVKGLGNGRLYHIGKFDAITQTVVKGSSTLSNEYPWWNDLYQDASIEEVSWDSGATVEEIQDQLDMIAEKWPGYTFETFAYYDGIDDADEYNLVAIYSDPTGAEFLAQIENDTLLDVTPDVARVLGYSDDYPMEDDYAE